ncbi:TetR family transcriptional regulator [Desertibaculum subflavum]|uniref:TetR family transcriptional regulator n=1 Tax=Desertibaculum subflavum TaxID=2268458 RepID=UPI000E66EBDD
MGRPRRAANDEDAVSAEAALLDAALGCFVAQGYHGTTMRDIAARARLAVSASYYYFPAKLDLLRRLMVRVTEDLEAALSAAEREAGDMPAVRLAAVVRAHVLFHTHRRAESFIGNSELRSLPPADRAEIVAMRDRIGAHFKRALEAGIRARVFAIPDPQAAVLAIVTMCTAVATWYREDGPATPEQIADRYALLARRMVGAAER